jgi:glucarate dehydratase
MVDGGLLAALGVRLPEDDIIDGGMFEYEGGSIKVPDGPGSGVSLDRDKLDEYAQLYKELGGYPYDRDPGNPGRYPLVPKQRFADPHKSITPHIPTGQTRHSPGTEVR